MRIDSAGGGSIRESSLEQSSKPRSTSGKRESRSAEGATSETAVGRLAAAALGAPDVRMDKVASLRAQIESGTYGVSAEQVAASMLEQMRARS